MFSTFQLLKKYFCPKLYPDKREHNLHMECDITTIRPPKLCYMCETKRTKINHIYITEVTGIRKRGHNQNPYIKGNFFSCLHLRGQSRTKVLINCVWLSSAVPLFQWLLSPHDGVAMFDHSLVFSLTRVSSDYMKFTLPTRRLEHCVTGKISDLKCFF